MKKMMTFVLAVLVGTLIADDVSSALAKARGEIGAVVATPAKAASVMSTLSSPEQRQFLAEVNAAISKLPASPEERAAKFLSVDRAVLKNAAKGNVSALIAEIFATASVDALPVLAESIGSDLINRATNPKTTYTDDQFTQIAKELMVKINERMAEEDVAAPRSAFAIVMLAIASNGTPADLTDTLIDTLPEDSRAVAREEWIPSALGQNGRDKSYEPLLASADAGRRPDFDMVLVIAGPQIMESVLADLTGKNTDEVGFSNTRTPIVDAVTSQLGLRVPSLGGDISATGIASQPAGGDAIPGGEVVPTPGPSYPEPGPYQWQRK